MPGKTFSWQEYMNAWNTGNVDRILDAYAEDCIVETGATPQPVHGKQELRKNLQGYFKAFSDMNGDAEVLVASGEYVAALLRTTSVNTGVMEIPGQKPIPATNKTVKNTLAVFLQLNEQGKIAREWDVSNQLAAFQQLGVPPPMTGASATGTTTPRRA